MTALEEEGPRGPSRASTDQGVGEGRAERRPEGRRSLCRPGMVAIMEAEVPLATVGWIHTGKSSYRCLSASSQSHGGENLEWKMM